MAAVETQKLMTAEAISDYIGDVQVETILKWARQGRIPSVKVTHKIVRFDLDEVRKALAESNDR